MKAADAIIAWNSNLPHNSADPNRGSIEVGPFPDTTGWSDKYDTTIGAVFAGRRDISDWQQTAMVFIDFQTAVVGYGIDPRDAHHEFLKIDEYRYRIAPDIAGAEDRPETT